MWGLEGLEPPKLLKGGGGSAPQKNLHDVHLYILIDNLLECAML